MKINPAMLALSAANPGLLGLAFEADDISVPSLRSPYERRGNHSHHHSGRVSVTHDFADGSGAELRGVPVNRERCLAAYAAALDCIGRLELEKEGEMKQQEADIEAEREAKDREEVARLEERKRAPFKAYEDRELERRMARAEKEKLRERIQLLRQEGRTFFGMGPFIRAEEIEKLQSKVDAILMPPPLAKPKDFGGDDYWFTLGLIYPKPWIFIPTKRENLKSQKGTISKKQMVAKVASGEDFLLSEEDAVEVARIEAGDYLRKLEDIFDQPEQGGGDGSKR